MPSALSLSVADKAKFLYETRLRSRLESLHPDSYVAIEPESGDYFLGATGNEAVQAASRAHPDKLSYILRVGHSAAFQLGAMSN
jgi:hypothetical protein